MTGLLQVGVIISVVGAALYFSRAPEETADISASGPVPVAKPAVTIASAPLVRVIRPIASTHTVQIATTGTISVRNHVTMTSEVSGRIAAISSKLRTGGTFSAGEELLRIDHADFALAVNQAEADIAAARATLRLREAEGNAAVSNYALLNPGRAVPPLVAKEPQIDQARAQLVAALARAERARLDLSRTIFSLPFDGRVTLSSAEVGQLLARGQSFGTAFALDAVEAVIPIAPDQLALIDPVIGRTAIVRSGGREFTASVERVSAELDERSRFAKLYLGLENGHVLTPGTFVDVDLIGPVVADSFVIPEAAQQTGGTAWIVVNQELQRIEPRVRGFGPDGQIVDAFNFGNGIVVGTVPGGRDGMAVQLPEPASISSNSSADDRTAPRLTRNEAAGDSPPATRT